MAGTKEGAPTIIQTDNTPTTDTNCASIRAFPQPLMTLTGADQPAGQEDEHSPHDDLEDRREQRRVHVAFANPRNNRQFSGHDDERDGCGQIKIPDH